MTIEKVKREPLEGLIDVAHFEPIGSGLVQALDAAMV